MDVISTYCIPKLRNGFTGSNAEWAVVYFESFSSKKEAVNREKQVKKWKIRKRVDSLINKSKI
ncbi:hypothetical protein C9994_02430 [Marivirga lumbricoides]|uniref:Excinuclease ABC subunit C n=1 Tax=Marivirga lumbricoides TaxID=1046115 RepID=A0A2T4DUR8_9BACT|nr:hypothetical protein C9994_02430 [Marivirga lumbricoides]